LIAIPCVSIAGVLACSNSNSGPAASDASIDAQSSGGTVSGSGGAGTTTGGAPASGGTTTGTGGAAGKDGGGTTGAGGTAGKDAGPDGGGAELSVAVTVLTADQTGVAPNTDAKLVNAWGVSINPAAQGGPAIWISDNGTGLSTVYDSTGKALPVTVKIPVPGDAGAVSAPTGQVFNSNASMFMGDKFVFVTEDGTVSGWASGAAATTRADRSGAGANYKGAALVERGSTPVLAVADFGGGKVDVFDSSYALMAAGTAFKDAALPAGFAPFNVAVLDGKVYVAYAKQDAMKHDDVKGVGNGYVDSFAPDGTTEKRLVSGGTLNSPWALAIAPSSFGALAGALLVGNFGDGKVHAFDAATGASRGELTNAGSALVINGLWALVAGPKADAGDLSQTLFYTAGPSDEAHGRFGKITAQ
jgi:uncharacterized protein (TIGR03118 family)